MGLADSYEALPGAGLLVAVRVVPDRNTEERLMNFVATGDAADTQNLVVINHESSLTVLVGKRTSGGRPRVMARPAPTLWRVTMVPL